MRPFFILFFLSAFLSPLSAHAQESEINIFGHESQSAIKRILSADEKKTIAALDSKALAEQYYDHCLESETSGLKSEEHETLCACKAGKMSAEMEPDEIRQLASSEPRSAAVKDRVIAQIGIPCMAFALKSNIRELCLRSMLKYPPETRAKICACQYRNMGYHIEDISFKALEHLMTMENKAAHEIEDIPVKILNHKRFETYMKIFTKSCISNKRYDQPGPFPGYPDPKDRLRQK